MESNNITIQKMSKQDLQYLKETLTSEFDDFWTYSILEKEYYGENTTYIVAKQNNELIGFAGILNIIDEANIMNIVTRKNMRNLGVGTLLLSELINISKLQKMKSITLEVNEHNLPAISLYKKFNFDIIGLRKKYYNNEDSAIIMTLYL